jgi:hypothetical protein
LPLIYFRWLNVDTNSMHIKKKKLFFAHFFLSLRSRLYFIELAFLYDEFDNWNCQSLKVLNWIVNWHSDWALMSFGAIFCCCFFFFFFERERILLYATLWSIHFIISHCIQTIAAICSHLQIDEERFFQLFFFLSRLLIFSLLLLIEWTTHKVTLLNISTSLSIAANHRCSHHLCSYRSISSSFLFIHFFFSFFLSL